MLRERSPSPPVSQSKRTPPLPQLNTRFTPEEMDQAPELEDKKRFLTMFRLSHVTAQQRKGKRCKLMHRMHAGGAYQLLAILLNDVHTAFFVQLANRFLYIVIVLERAGLITWPLLLTMCPNIAITLDVSFQ